MASEGAQTAKTAAVGASPVVSIPESVVAPLIGAGANVYILTNELTQSMREKLGTSWPFLQDTLNSRFAKLAAGGLLTSVAAIVLYKVIKRLVHSKPKSPPPGENGEDGVQWRTTKTFEVTPVTPGSGVKWPVRPEGEQPGPVPLHMLPHKIQLRIAETPQATRGQDSDTLCKARETPVSRNRHTRCRDQPGEPPRGDPFSPGAWHAETGREEQAGRGRAVEEEEEEDDVCSCPAELCGQQHQASPPGPRLLYSVRESRVVQRAMGVSEPPHLVNVLGFSSSSACSPSAPTPLVCTSHTSPVGLYQPPVPVSPYTSLSQQCPLHGAQAGPSLLVSPSLQHSAPHCIMQGQPCVHGGPGELCPALSSRHGSLMAAGAAHGDRDVGDAGLGRGEDKQRPFTCSDHEHGAAPLSVPTRVAQSSVTPSHCNSAPHTTPNFQANLTHSFNVSQSANRRESSCSHQEHSGTQQQQQQRPVVQQPSESTMSQVTSVMCAESQEGQRFDRDGHSISSHTAATAEGGPQERVRGQREVGGARSNAFALVPHRAAGDHSQHDYPWRGASSLHGYQPSPVYMCGVHPQHNHSHYTPHQPAWLNHGAMYVPHSHVHNGMYGHTHPTLLPHTHSGLYPHSQAGLYAAAQHGLFPPQGGLYGHSPMCGGPCPNPFLFAQGTVPDSKPMIFNPNFNLSNSNPHVFDQQAGDGSGASGACFTSGDSARLRWVEADTSPVFPSGDQSPGSAAGHSLTVDEDLLESASPSVSEQPEAHFLFHAQPAAQPDSDQLASPEAFPAPQQHPSVENSAEPQSDLPSVMTLPTSDLSSEGQPEVDASGNNEASQTRAESTTELSEDLFCSAPYPTTENCMASSDGVETQL